MPTRVHLNPEYVEWQKRVADWAGLDLEHVVNIDVVVAPERWVPTCITVELTGRALTPTFITGAAGRVLLEGFLTIPVPTPEDPTATESTWWYRIALYPGCDRDLWATIGPRPDPTTGATDDRP